MNLRHLLRLCSGSTLLLITIQAPTLAQTVVETVAGQGAANRQPSQLQSRTLNLQLYTPDLPPITPVLPDVPAEEVRLVLRLRERRVYVYQGDQVKASYPVAIGRRGWETPTGQFTVLGMLENPGWTNPFTRDVIPPGPNNPLGDRWIAFWTDGRNFVGFHGTPNRESVGRAASHGCVRMYNEDVRKLFDVVQVGTSVTVEQ